MKVVTNALGFVIRFGHWFYAHAAQFFITLLLFIASMVTINILMVRYSPDWVYVLYTGFTVQGDIEQGERAVATICRTAAGDYNAEGYIEFFLTDETGRRVYTPPNVEFPKHLSKGTTCEDEQMPTSDLKPGTYKMHLYRSVYVSTWSAIRVEKNANIESNSFRVKE